MIRYPKLIKAAEEKLECVRDDIKEREGDSGITYKTAVNIKAKETV